MVNNNKSEVLKQIEDLIIKNGRKLSSFSNEETYLLNTYFHTQPDETGYQKDIRTYTKFKVTILHNRESQLPCKILIDITYYKGKTIRHIYNPNCLPLERLINLHNKLIDYIALMNYVNISLILISLLPPVNQPKRTNIRNQHGQTIGYRTTETKQDKVITTDTYKDHKVVTTTKDNKVTQTITPKQKKGTKK